MEYFTPGQLISGLLDKRGWSQRSLSIVLDVSETIINRLITDKRSIDPELALTLEEIFSVPAERFLKLQVEYDLKKAKLRVKPDPQRSIRATLYGDLPISDMIKRGWLDAENIKDKNAVEVALCQFFGVNDMSNIELLPHAAKRTEISSAATPAQLAWIYRVRQIASEMLVSNYTPKKLDAAISRLKSLLYSVEEARHVPKILAESGIRFLLVETLPKAKIDGVCFWLDESSPVVALTARYDRIDNFWFVLRHELEHVKQCHGISKVMIDIDVAAEQNNVINEEKEANSVAAEFCVPQKMLDAFIRKKAPFFAERDLRGFAKSIQVHPGLIAGQLQYKTNDYRRFRNHLVPIRSIIAPSATVDGWGDIYPTE